MLVYCRATVCDAGPTLNQHWVSDRVGWVCSPCSHEPIAYNYNFLPWCVKKWHLTFEISDTGWRLQGHKYLYLWSSPCSLENVKTVIFDTSRGDEQMRDGSSGAASNLLTHMMMSHCSCCGCWLHQTWGHDWITCDPLSVRLIVVLPPCPHPNKLHDCPTMAEDLARVEDGCLESRTTPADLHLASWNSALNL